MCVYSYIFIHISLYIRINSKIIYLYSSIYIHTCSYIHYYAYVYLYIYLIYVYISSIIQGGSCITDSLLRGSGDPRVHVIDTWENTIMIPPYEYAQTHIHTHTQSLMMSYDHNRDNGDKMMGDVEGVDERGVNMNAMKCFFENKLCVSINIYFIHIHKHIHICYYIYTSIYTHKFLYTHTFTYMLLYIHIPAYLYTTSYILMHIHIHIHICI